MKDGVPAERSEFFSLSRAYKPLAGLKHKSEVKFREEKGNREACLGAMSYVGNLGNPAHTFSNFDVDVLSHPELTEGGDCPVLPLGPVKEVLVAMGKGLLLDLAGEREVARLKVDL